MARLLYTANRIGVRVIVGKRSAKGVVLGEVASDCIYECEHVVTVRVNYSCDPIRAAPGAVRLPTSSPVSDGRAVQPSWLVWRHHHRRFCRGRKRKEEEKEIYVWSSSSSLNALDEIPVCHLAGGGAAVRSHRVREDIYFSFYTPVFRVPFSFLPSYV